MVTLLIATRNAHKAEEIRAILGDGFRCLTLDELPGAPEIIEDAGTFAGNALKKAVGLAKWRSRMRNAECGMRSGERAGETPNTKHQTPKPEMEMEAPASDIQQPATSTQHPTFVLADDSGLEVESLHGAPGVHSARFAALDTGLPGNSPTAQNNAKLLRLLEGVPSERRTARFRCVLALTSVPGEVAAENASAVCYADEAELGAELFEGVCEGRIGFGLRGQGGFGYDPLFFPAGYELTFGEMPEELKNKLSHRAAALAKLKRWFEERASPGLTAPPNLIA